MPVSNAIPVTILYPGPSPHAADLFNAMAEDGGFDVEAFFCAERFIEREGWPNPEFRFPHHFLLSRRIGRGEFAVWNPGLMKHIGDAAGVGRIIMVGGGYTAPSVARAMAWLSRHKAHWYFFSEKPGISGGVIKSTLRRFLIRTCLGDCAGILAHSPPALEAYRSLGFEEGKLHFVPYAMDVEPFRAIARSALPAEPNRPLRLLYCGRLHEIKGIDWLIEALGKYRTPPGEYVLSVVGEGPLRDRVAQRIDALRLGARVKLWGEIAWGRRSEVFADHDALLVPSRHDGWGMVVMEALAAGMPVLATTRVGAAAAYVRERETGFRFDFGNNPQLHGALDYCISHKDEVRRMGIEARRSVESWTPRNVADQIRRIVLEDWARRRK